MNEEQILRTLASAARNDAPPALDVSGDVLSRIEARPRARRANVLMWSYAAVSAVAATFVAFWMVHLLRAQELAALDFLGPAVRALP